jgi:hypothetical protein
VSSKIHHRAAKKRQKQRKKRQSAQDQRGSRKVLGMASDRIEQAQRWPMSDCWASDNWHEQGATVEVCFTRRHEDGRMAAAFFTIDLADKGVVQVSADAPLTLTDIHGKLAKRGANGHAMLEVEPSLVVKLVDTGRDFGVKQGHVQPSGLKRARKLFAGIRGGKCPHDITTGPYDPNAPKASPRSRGLFEGLKKRIFG